MSDMLRLGEFPDNLRLRLIPHASFNYDLEATSDTGFGTSPVVELRFVADADHLTVLHTWSATISMDEKTARWEEDSTAVDAALANSTRVFLWVTSGTENRPWRYGEVEAWLPT